MYHSLCSSENAERMFLIVYAFHFLQEYTQLHLLTFSL